MPFSILIAPELASATFKMKCSVCMLFAAVIFGHDFVVSASANPSQSQDSLSVSVGKLIGKILARESEADHVLTRRSSEESGKLQGALDRLKRADAEMKLKDKAVLAEAFVRLLERKVKKQDLSDKEKAETASLLSDIKQKLVNFGNKVKSGFKSFQTKVKNFFHGRK